MATKKQRSISCSDEDWLAIQGRAKAKLLSVSEYLVAISDVDEDTDTQDKSPNLNDETSIRRAIWFLYADRRDSLKKAGEQDRVNALIKEAKGKFE